LLGISRAPPRGGFRARQGTELSEKKVRAFSIKDHQTGSCGFWAPSAPLRSPRLRARLARNCAIFSANNSAEGGIEAIFIPSLNVK